jgi:branched-chain amino acid transport system substrate-binding protein
MSCSIHFASHTTMNVRHTRRRTVVLGALASVAGPISAQPVPRTGQKALRWVQLGDTSSVNGRLGADLLSGASMALDEVNARGGMFGRRIEVEPLDTRGEPARVAELLNAAKERTDLFGVLSIRGTAEAAAAFKALPGWPIFGPNTGADPVRKAAPPNVLFVRASWSAEVDRLMAVSKTIGFTKVGIVCPEGPVGQVVRGLVDAVAGKHGLSVNAIATIPHPTSFEVAPAAAKLARADVQLVVVALAAPAADFMLQARKAGLFVPMYTLSDAIGPEFVAKLKNNTSGIGFSSPMPSPWDRSMLLVRDYQDAMGLAKRTSKDYTFASFEGYVNARLLIEVLKRVGPDVSRERFIDTARSLKIADFGGVGVDFTRGNSGLSYTSVFVLGPNGRVMR